MRMDYYRRYQEIVGDYNREKETTQSEVETMILDHLFTKLPSPPFDPDEIENAASRIYQHLWTIGKSDSHTGEAA